MIKKDVFNDLKKTVVKHINAHPEDKNKCYVFANCETLIDVMPVPEDIMKSARKTASSYSGVYRELCFIYDSYGLALILKT